MISKRVLRILVGLLAGCACVVHCVNAAELDVNDLTLLMRIAEPEWRQNEAPQMTRRCNDEGNCTDEVHTLTPRLVFQIAANRVVLIASGTPTDALGNINASHASAGFLNAYWLEKRGDHWVRTRAQDKFAWEGFFGQVGSVHDVEFGFNAKGFSVENGSCWQGACVAYVAIYRIEALRVSKVLSEVVSSDNLGATVACEALLQSKSGGAFTEEEFSEALGCYAIRGVWRFQKTKNPINDIEMIFDGFSVDTLKVEQVTNLGRPDKLVYQVKMKPLHEKLRYRYVQDRYELIQGNNPNIIP